MNAHRSELCKAYNVCHIVLPMECIKAHAQVMCVLKVFTCAVGGGGTESRNTECWWG